MRNKDGAGMERNSAYSALAEYFEYLNDDCDYEKWSQYLIKRLSGYALTDGLDVGCGGGYFTRALQRAGYLMTGMDISPEMLDKAQRTAMQEGVRSEYLLGDVSGGKLARKVSFVTAINDCLNYVDGEKLTKAFKNVYSCLKKGGVFLFDVSSPKKYAEKFCGAVNVDDRDDVTYMSFTSTDGKTATMEVTLFVKMESGDYRRYDETHVQYVHTEETILSALTAAGFKSVEVEGHMGEEKSLSDRLVFLAQK
jgi:SAM-dependent methyltransferase